jgi:16S rRNA processing protein RimM
METIPLADCTKIGFLQKPHGIHGEMVLVFDEEFEESVAQAKIFFVKAEGYLVPFFVEDVGFWIKSANQALVKFRWIDSCEKARQYSGYEVHLKTADIVNSGEKNSPEELIGFDVFDSLKNRIGIIDNVDDYSGNIVLTVNYRGKEVLVPFHPDMVEILDAKQKILQMIIPDGLIGGDDF